MLLLLPATTATFTFTAIIFFFDIPLPNVKQKERILFGAILEILFFDSGQIGFIHHSIIYRILIFLLLPPLISFPLSLSFGFRFNLWFWNIHSQHLYWWHFWVPKLQHPFFSSGKVVVLVLYTLNDDKSDGKILFKKKKKTVKIINQIHNTHIQKE